MPSNPPMMHFEIFCQIVLLEFFRYFIFWFCNVLSWVATVLENPRKSWKWGKTFLGPGKSLNLGRGSWKAWNRQNIYFSISKNNKNVLLVKIFLMRKCCRTKTATSQGLIFGQSDLSLVVFHCQDKPIQ